MGWTQILIAIVALWGAILSTFNLITKRHQERAKVKVKLQTHILTWGPQVGPAMVALTAYNISKEVVFLSSFGFKLPDKRTMIFPNPQSDVSFPHKLLPGTNCNVRVEYKILAQELTRNNYRNIIKLIGFYGDSADNTYISKPWKFNIEEELKSNP